MLAPRIVTDEVSGLLQLLKLNQDSLNFNILQLHLHTGVDLGIGSVVPATAVKNVTPRDLPSLTSRSRRFVDLQFLSLHSD